MQILSKKLSLQLVKPQTNEIDRPHKQKALEVNASNA